MDRIYLDNAATTKPSEAAVEAAMDAVKRNYGNPSSKHLMGLEAERIINGARKEIAAKLGVDMNNIFFTSGGTESNNLAIIGSAMAFRRKGRIITTKIEHKSVLNPFKHLENEGYTVEYIDVDENGTINLAELEDKLDEDVQLVSIMYVNNEVGTIQPIQQAYQLVKNNSFALFHVDAVQAFCKLKDRIKADLISISAHKIGGVKGCGALYVADKIRVKPMLYGGGHELGLRSGTENVPGIAAFGAVCNEIDIDKNFCKVKELNSELRRINGAKILSPENASPYILCVAFEGVKSEMLLHSLEEKGVFVSSGSACSSNKPDQSHVLSAMGYKPSVIDSAIRLSLSGENTMEEINKAVEIIEETANNLKKVMSIRN